MASFCSRARSTTPSPYFADHAQEGSHDTLKRFLENERITPNLVFDNVKDQLITTEKGYIVFDDTVLGPSP